MDNLKASLKVLHEESLKKWLAILVIMLITDILEVGCGVLYYSGSSKTLEINLMDNHMLLSAILLFMLGFIYVYKAFPSVLSMRVSRWAYFISIILYSIASCMILNFICYNMIRLIEELVILIPSPIQFEFVTERSSAVLIGYLICINTGFVVGALFYRLGIIRFTLLSLLIGSGLIGLMSGKVLLGIDFKAVQTRIIANQGWLVQRGLDNLMLPLLVVIGILLLWKAPPNPR